MPLQIEIPLPTPSLNKCQRMHFHERKRLRDQYETICRLSSSPSDRVRAKQFCHVEIVRFGVRRLDEDNFVGGCKLLVDALVRAELVYDDSQRFVKIGYRQEKAKAAKVKTLVTITKYPPSG